MKPYAFGVDIGGTTVKIGFFKTDGTKLDSYEIPTRTEDGGKNVLPDVSASLENYLKEKGIGKDQVEGIGLGVPGPTTEDGIVKKCVNLGWGIINAAKEMENLIGIPTRAGNDANVAALGEQWKGGASGYQNVVMITLGTGVGSGIIIGGKIVSGADGAAGEFGHVCVNEEEEEACNCGHKGCLEQYASATGIVRLAKRYMEKHPGEQGVLYNLENVTAKDVFDAAKESDDAALAIVDEFADILGKALATLTAILNPEAIVIGGGVSKAGEILLQAVREKYRIYAIDATKDTVFCLATLGNDAGIYGCAGLML